nr:hypothetical protein [Candidatus Kuenenia stuttgartiensis]
MPKQHDIISTWRIRITVSGMRWRGSDSERDGSRTRSPKVKASNGRQDTIAITLCRYCLQCEKIYKAWVLPGYVESVTG